MFCLNNKVFTWGLKRNLPHFLRGLFPIVSVTMLSFLLLSMHFLVMFMFPQMLGLNITMEFCVLISWNAVADVEASMTNSLHISL